MSNFYADPLQPKCEAKGAVQTIVCRYLFDASWILGWSSLPHSLAWCIYQVFAMSCEVVTLIVQLDVWFFPLLFAKQLSNFPLSIVLLRVAMPPHAPFFLFVKTYQRSCFDKPCSSTIWQTTLPTKNLQHLKWKKKSFQLYLATWILILTKYEHHLYIHAFNYIHSYNKRISL